MRLGDVFESTRSEPPPPAPRWRPRDLLLVTLGLGLFIAALIRLGPGLSTLDDGDIGVTRARVDLDLLGPAISVDTEPGPTFYVPVVEGLTALPARHREVAASVEARARHGAPLRLQGARALYRATAASAPRLLDALGDEPATWDEAARVALRAALRARIAAEPLYALRTAEPEAVFAPTETDLRARLAEVGLELVRFRAPTWRLDPGLGQRLHAIDAQHQRAADLRGQIAGVRAQADQRIAKLDAEQGAALTQLEDDLRARRAAAEATAEQTRLDADRYAIHRRAQATAHREAARAHAAAEARVAEVRAQGLAARAEALESGDADALLDYEIARQIIPQLRRVRTMAHPPVADTPGTRRSVRDHDARRHRSDARGNGDEARGDDGRRTGQKRGRSRGRSKDARPEREPMRRMRDGARDGSDPGRAGPGRDGAQGHRRDGARRGPSPDDSRDGRRDGASRRLDRDAARRGPGPDREGAQGHRRDDVRRRPSPDREGAQGHRRDDVRRRPSPDREGAQGHRRDDVRRGPSPDDSRDGRRDGASRRLDRDGARRGPSPDRDGARDNRRDGASPRLDRDGARRGPSSGGPRLERESARSDRSGARGDGAAVGVGEDARRRGRAGVPGSTARSDARRDGVAGEAPAERADPPRREGGQP